MATTILDSINVPSLTFPLPPAIQPIVTAVEGSADGLLLTAIWCSFLIPIAIALILSNPRNWKTPIFVMNIFAIALGLAFGVITINFHRRNIALNPVGPRYLLAMSCLYFFTPISTQSILLFRVAAVYPLRELSTARGLFIYGTFAVTQTTRLINTILSLVKASRFMGNGADLGTAAKTFWALPYVKVELFLQLAYDIFASTLFLLRLREGGSYASRLRGLFWIAVFNFVFPVILNITTIVFLFRDPKIDHGADVMVVNIYVDIICVVLATVWCSGTHWQRATDPAPPGAPSHPSEEKTILSVSTATFAPPSIHPAQTQVDLDV
ncbi:hypothetical protein GSI_12188 [Ganoderma sinense ZZ0214-1]|uniref:Uncharacterized protein n=1 Tax=Ganoderma sinense ZZ0214-1 TaxID=1077348 RepID=A0A2G8RY39_9APHY|nr:hypothetical protein GSI_12188 [Ganoderma sinense ZZ0214-1]